MDPLRNPFRAALIQLILSHCDSAESHSMRVVGLARVNLWFACFACYTCNRSIDCIRFTPSRSHSAIRPLRKVTDGSEKKGKIHYPAEYKKMCSSIKKK